MGMKPKLCVHVSMTNDRQVAGGVEVGRVWLELPSPIILLNQIQAVLGNRIQLGLQFLIQADLYIYIYIRFVI